MDTTKLRYVPTDHRTVLCWDIDGTLLSTNGIGFKYLYQASLQLTGQRLKGAHKDNHGLTDYEILIKSFTNSNFPAENALTVANNVLQKYVELYRDAQDIHRIRPYPIFNSAFFSTLVGHGILNVIVSGNCFEGALLKLQQSKLEAFFDLDKSFFSSSTNWRRDMIVKNALELHGKTRTVVVGDTPRDYYLAKSFGLRCALLNWRHDSVVDGLTDDENLTVFREQQLLTGSLLNFLTEN